MEKQTSGAQSRRVVAVIGAGTMGAQISALFAFYGHDVLIFDAIVPKNVDSRMAITQRFLRRGTAGAEKQTRLGKITVVDDIGACSMASLVIECVPEDMNVKSDVLRKLGTVLPHTTTIATNTSSLSIEALSASIPNSECFLGMHFFNPVHAVPLVEVCPTSKTQSQVAESSIMLLESMERIVVRVPDVPGFIVNQLLFLMIASAARMVDKGMSAETIDRAMKAGTGMPRGPLELADLIGLDVCLLILKNLYQRTSESVFDPPQSIVSRVSSGELGRKTGRGFYRKGK